MANRIFASRSRVKIFLVLGVWAIAVQTLGAFGFDPLACNNRSGYEIQEQGCANTTVLPDETEAIRRIQEEQARPIGKIPMNIGLARFRYRLWQIGDSQIAFFFTPKAFASAKATRQGMMNVAYREKAAIPPH